MARGVLITFEGIDGSGKSTQISRLQSFLGEKGYRTLVTFEPGGAPGNEEFRKILLSHAGTSWSPMAEAFLFMADRAQHVKEVIRPALERGEVVICDRYADSTLAYQGYGRGQDKELIKAMNQAAIGDCIPDLTVIILIDIGIGLERARNSAADRGSKTDRIESDAEGAELFARIQDGYRDIAAQETERILLVNGELTPEQIFSEIKPRVLKSLEKSGVMLCP